MNGTHATRARSASRILILLAAAQLVACASQRPVAAPHPAEPVAPSRPASPLQSLNDRLVDEGERNAVLNYDRLGLAALEQGDLHAAAAAFDEATSRIDRVYADDPNAQRAKSLWSEERVKDFKGEPYERSMAFYYRGLIYAADGDFENSRASFLAAQFQDSQAESDEFVADFALMDFLAGWSSYCAGDPIRGDELVRRASEVRPELRWLHPERTRHLAILEAGEGPAKIAAGKHGEKLTFADREGAAPRIRVAHAYGVVPAIEAGDVFFQASTRGGRAIEAVLDGKASFKDAANSIGNVALGASLGTAIASRSFAAAGNRDLAAGNAYASLGLLAVSLVSKAASAATTPAADTRYWESLPRNIYLAALPAHPSRLRGLEASAGGAGTRLAALGSSASCSLAWSRVPVGPGHLGPDHPEMPPVQAAWGRDRSPGQPQYGVALSELEDGAHSGGF